MKLKDFKGIFNKSTATVISVENVSADYWIVKLKPAEGVAWIPGEHGIFTFPEKDFAGKKWRAFSIASIPDEGYMMIGTRTGDQPSSFKKKLTALKPGQTVKVRGPFGWFTLKDKSSPIVFIAGGVGITPVRALLKEMEKKNQRIVDLVHVSSDHFLFRDNIEGIAAANPKLNLHYARTPDETKAALKQLSAVNGDKAYYYISGSLGMMRSIRKLLKKENIKGSRFIHDPFLGY